MNDIIKYISENPLIVGLAIAGVLFIIMVVAIILIVNHKDEENYTNIISSLTTPRIFICNLKADEVIYFDRGVYKNQRKGQMTQFYEQFTAHGIDELEKWIQKLLIPKSGVELYHEVDVFVKSEKRSYVSVLEVKRIDYEKQLIHLESYLYRYLRPKHQMNNARRRRDNVGYLSDENLAKLYHRRFTRGTGAYASISIINKVIKKNTKMEIPPHIIYELRNQTAIYHSKRVIIHFAKEKYVGLYLPFALDEEDITKIVKNIISRTQGYFELNGYEDFSLAAGIITHNIQFSEMEVGVKTAQELSDFAQHEKDKVLVYSSARETKDLDLSVYRSEVARIVSRKNVEPLFQPLLSATSADIQGYLVSYTLNSSLFSSYAQLATFVRENKEVEGLSQMVIRKSAASYYNKQRNANHKLFLPLDVEEYPSFEKIAAKQSTFSEIKFVFIITEESLSKNFNDVTDMSAFITRVKEEEHEIALLIREAELNLPDDVYSKVDYFMVDETILEATHKDERELLYLLASLGKLLRHKKKIMITDISKWSEIEYYIRAGVDFIASNEISKRDYNLQTIEKKKALRIINFSRRN